MALQRSPKQPVRQSAAVEELNHRRRLFWVLATFTASISLPSKMLRRARTHNSTDTQHRHKGAQAGHRNQIPKCTQQQRSDNLTAALDYSYREWQRGSEFPKQSSSSHLVVRRVDVSGVSLMQGSYIHTCAAQQCCISLLAHLLNSEVAMPTLLSTDSSVRRQKQAGHQ